MTVLHPVAPAQRTGEAPLVGSPSSAEALELLRAAEALGGDTDRRCEGLGHCRRPGALTLVTADGTTALCGLHAMNAVFSTAGGTLALVRPAT